jgi:hypothetical protein
MLQRQLEQWNKLKKISLMGFLSIVMGCFSGASTSGIQADVQALLEQCASQKLKVIEVEKYSDQTIFSHNKYYTVMVEDKKDAAVQFPLDYLLGQSGGGIALSDITERYKAATASIEQGRVLLAKLMATFGNNVEAGIDTKERAQIFLYTDSNANTFRLELEKLYKEIKGFQNKNSKIQYFWSIHIIRATTKKVGKGQLLGESRIAMSNEWTDQNATHKRGILDMNKVNNFESFLENFIPKIQ